MNYKSILVTRRGGPEALQTIELPLHPPAAGEVRVKVLAASVSLVDIEARYGRSPFPPKIPFTPGYAIVGIIDAIGTGIAKTTVGDQVASLTVYGGYSEYVYLPEKKLIPVPAGLEPAEVVPLILNYLVAYQSMHRSAKVKAGDKALIIGASGGIGTAILQLGRLAGLKMYGIASARKHAILDQYGATPIDYHTQDFAEVIRRAEPQGLDWVFDGIGGDYLQRGFSLLKRGGKWVGYANPMGFGSMLRLLGRIVMLNLLPNGRSVTWYGTGASYLNRQPFLKDWAALFESLASGQIRPVIAATFPITEAAKANALLEDGGVVGNIVLLAPDWQPTRASQ